MIEQILLRAILISNLLILYATAITVQYKNYASTPNYYSSFDLGYVSSGTNITIIVNPKEVSSSYNILLWRPQTQDPQQSPFQKAGSFVGAKAFTTNMVDISGNWRVEILPTDDDFLFGLQVTVNNQSIKKSYGVASYGRIFAIYYGSSGSYTASLGIGSGSLSDIAFDVYGPFNSLTVSGGTAVGLKVNQGSYNALIFYQVAGPSYYYIVVKPNFSTYSPSSSLINIRYSTDIYQCPYTKGINDPNEYFQGCSLDAPTRDYPCLNFYDGKCRLCDKSYQANDQGVCIASITCPEMQYFHFGNCWPIIDNCMLFQKIGDGTCKLCKAGYNLINYSNGTQSCEQAIPVCIDRQYLIGKTCYNRVDNCAEFIQMNGTCQTCSYGYKLLNNRCEVIQVPVIVCPIGQSLINGVCQVSDPNCIYYGSSLTCQKCAFGWLPGPQKCQQIICGSRQYSYKGFCEDVSPFCDTYDPIFGSCRTCIYNYYLQENGSCIQSFGGVTLGTSKQKQQYPCQEGYYPIGSTCMQVSSLCDGYNQENGNCLACKDKQKYGLDNGVCKDVNTLCSLQPRTFFKNGSCVPLSKLCDDFYPSNGSCITCLDNSQLDTQTGRCLYKNVCNEYESYDEYGRCVKGDGSCKKYSFQTNSCQLCADNYELNGDFCCKISYYIGTPQCKAVLKQNCAKWSQINGCFTCSPGYQKTGYFFFSKCKPV